MSLRRRARPQASNQSDLYSRRTAEGEDQELSRAQLREITDAFDDAIRSARIQAGEDVSDLPNPYNREKTGRGKQVDKEKDAGATGGAGSGGLFSELADAGGFLLEDQADDAANGGGGFLPDDAAGGGGGGFIPEKAGDDGGGGSFPSRASTSASSSKAMEGATHIPLEAIPAALLNLHLSPSDPLVLDICRDTAISLRRRHGEMTGRKVVSREDFVEVAKVLLTERGQMGGENASSDGRERLDPSEMDVDINDPSRRRRTRKRVAAASSPPSYKEASWDRDEEGKDEGDETDAPGPRKRGRRQMDRTMPDLSDDSEDEFRPSDDESTGGGFFPEEAEAVDSDDDYTSRPRGGHSKARRKVTTTTSAGESGRRRKGKGKARDDDLETMDEGDEGGGGVRLSARQESQVRSDFAAFFAFAEESASMKDGLGGKGGGEGMRGKGGGGMLGAGVAEKKEVKDLEKKKITFENIRTVATLLGEKLSDADIQEMLDEAGRFLPSDLRPAQRSSSSGVDLEVFRGIMVRNRLV